MKRILPTTKRFGITMKSIAISVLGVLITAAIMFSCYYGTSIECPGTGGFMCPGHMQCAPDGQPLCLDRKCGSGIVDSQSEQCDGGVNGEPQETAECNINCTKAVKGDGWVNTTAGEECDGDGQGHGGETAECDIDCTFAMHGDGVVNRAIDEECDGDNNGHGNGINCESSICTADCKWKTDATCRNGIVDGNDECDGDGQGNAGETKECDIDCTFAKHGDGVVNRQFNEQCDGDNNGTGNGENCESLTCNSDCIIRTENDGTLNTTAGEKCDKGDENGNLTCDEYGKICRRCTLDYQEIDIEGPKCGDGKVYDAKEQCDREESRECGTCNNDCENIGIANAKGSITVTSAKDMISNTNKTNTFTISDGRNEVAFEIKSDCAASTCIGISGFGINDLEGIAGHIAGKINEGRGNVRIKATKSGNNIALEGISSGRAGNEQIKSVGGYGLTIKGMSGGIGCDLRDYCARNEDCASGNCTAGRCK